MGLLLEAVTVTGRSRWRWLLSDEATRTPLADHTVSFEERDGREVEAFRDLPRFLRWNAEPDRRVESEAALVDRLGAWIGERVLGPSIAARILAAAPVTVRVRVPAEADFLVYAPLELAHVGGVPLARRGDVSLVFDVGGPPVARAAGADRLRMVAVFSLPTQSTALALRRERYELVQQVRALAARSRRMVELEVLQYGVTRELLERRVAAGGGPDVVHLSGHGGSGMVLLETADGGADPVEAGELVKVLAAARGRLRLVVLSACQSAAASTAETLRWLRLDEAADAAQATADAEADGAEVVTGLARMVASRVGCAVVAMRYPVVDDFAIALTSSLYEGLFDLDLAVDAALRRALPVAAGAQASPARPALSIATPTLLGPAGGLLLAPPRGRPPLDPAEVRMAAFPDEPARFVGRTGPMARASRSLASDSDRGGVLFHGMAGGGKTWCALEVAYRHQDRFDQPVWWRAPLRDEEWPTALTSLALALENQLAERGFAMVDKVGTADGLARFLPQLRALLRTNGLLVVLDNLETLLTPDGGWRDPRWADLMEVLSGHGGLSRLVLTSRVVPAGLSGMLVEPVHALSRDETVLLARELPNLRRLLHAEPGPERASPVQVDADRGRVRRVLQLVQGHPKLLELADRAAADEATLAAHLEAAEDAAGGQPLAAFFARGESTLNDSGFTRVLASWTTSAMQTLPDDARLLLQLLAGMEEDDRLLILADLAWAGLHQVLGLAGPGEDFGAAAAPLLAAALVEQRELAPPPGGADRVGWRYGLHPGVAETVRALTPDGVRTAVDTVLSGFWTGLIRAQIGREGGEDTATVVRAGLAAAPYLLRLADWDTAAWVVELALMRDETAGVAQVAVAYLRRVADATGAPDDIATLGRATGRIDAAAGERLVRAGLERAVAAEDHRTASAIAGELVNLLRDSGRLQEALELADRKVEIAERAGLGPWTRLSVQGQRLQIAYLMGQPEEVLTEARRLVADMARLPEQKGANETVNPFTVREGLLNLGVAAAASLGHWQEALDFSAEQLASMRARGAGDHAVTVVRFNEYSSLIRLGRLDEAELLLTSCQQVFEDYQDIVGLARVFGGRADLANRRGRHDQAVELEYAALRLTYASPFPDAIAMSHNNLAGYLVRAGADPADRIAHWIAAATIRRLIGQHHGFTGTVRALAREMREHPGAAVPATVADLALTVERVEGARFAALTAALTSDPGVAAHALATVLDAARTLPADDAYDVQRHRNEWEPELALLVAAVRGDQDAAATIDAILTGLARREDWASLAAVLRRILDGERDPDRLLPGLDPIDTAIATRALDALAGRITLRPVSIPPAGTDPTTVEPWPAIIAAVAAAASGDGTAGGGISGFLEELAARNEWASLAGVLHRIIAGARDPRQLLAGLDPTDTRIAAAVLERLNDAARNAEETT
ncbi:CHAT domain-containing protein [Dactylosporangium sp. NPDC000244]|uniref:CHAT domain-containing protein n=1 Tax=Dactylosporangium sp. NPDC000244 TaxID=3154365 RepID=UPI00333005BA